MYSKLNVGNMSLLNLRQLSNQTLGYILMQNSFPHEWIRFGPRSSCVIALPNPIRDYHISPFHHSRLVLPTIVLTVRFQPYCVTHCGSGRLLHFTSCYSSRQSTLIPSHYTCVEFVKTLAVINWLYQQFLMIYACKSISVADKYT